MWEYEVLLDGNIVGDNGEMQVETKEKAKEDADNYIINGLMEEYPNTKETDFSIKYYETDERWVL